MYDLLCNPKGEISNTSSITKLKHKYIFILVFPIFYMLYLFAYFENIFSQLISFYLENLFLENFSIYITQMISLFLYQMISLFYILHVISFCLDDISFYFKRISFLLAVFITQRIPFPIIYSYMGGTNISIGSNNWCNMIKYCLFYLSNINIGNIYIYPFLL